MKKILYVLALVAATSLVSCNEDLLNLEPTDEVSAGTLLSDADGAQVAINGVYRMMKELGWSNGWEAENPGILTRILVSDIMGEDHYMAAQGQGWFFFDHMFNVDSDYTSTSGRQYSQWKLYYTLISQVNYIIAKEEQLVAEGSKGADAVAQAYAVRAFCYMSLAECFCQGNFAVNKETPGVPLYLEPTSMDTKGQPRGTLADTYAQINKDYKAAYDLFKGAQENGVVQSHISHLDLYATCVLWAYTALAEGEWQRAYDLATEALTKPTLTKTVATVAELDGFNSIKVPTIMWGFEVLADQTGPYGPYHTHMDITGGYGSKAPQCWCPYLAASIPETDERTAWFSLDKNGNPVQNKIRIREAATSVADHILVRAEEAILIAAEAACRLKNYTEARAQLTKLGSVRDTAYAERLAARQDSEAYNEDTTAALKPFTLMDEVLWQRRVELWSEGFGRLYDLKRLNLGYVRLDGTEKAPGDYTFTYLLPQKEFDNNPAIDSVKDQNPR